MKYLILFFFASTAFAHDGGDKKNFFAKPSAATKPTCEFALGDTFDWDQPLLQGQDELKALARARSSSRLWLPWNQAVQNIPAIDEALKKAAPDKREYFARIHAAITSALLKHQLEFARSRDLNRMDVPRHMKILNEIAGFDPKHAEFSLYKIKRAIEGRYSLTEYSNCH